MINNSVSNSNAYNVSSYSKPVVSNESNKNSTEKTSSKVENKVENTGVIYEPSSSSKDTVSNPYDSFKSSLGSAMSQAELKAKNFEMLVSSVFKKQVKNVNKVSNLLKDCDDIAAKAKESISKDGYYGVEKTSERILSFAKAVAGDDPKKLAEMRTAVEKGFAKAEKLFGGKLPEISQKTYEKVMSEFDSLQGISNS